MGYEILKPEKVRPSIIKRAPQGSGGFIKAFWSEVIRNL